MMHKYIELLGEEEHFDFCHVGLKIDLLDARLNMKLMDVLLKRDTGMPRSCSTITRRICITTVPA